MIGRYEVVAPLATGGMGELVLAREHGPGGFERIVVVKRIRPQVAEEPDIVEAFLREARLVARLSHPNIVQIIELGQLEEADEYFIAMEYIEGSSVAELQILSALRERPIPLEVVVSVGIQACRGLEAAHDLRDAHGHSLGLIHRDVSPQNVMCTTDGFVKLLDFGIAKTTVGLDSTEPGALKGKPGYFSPEQARGDRLDRRTDIFSLGAVLWELVSGKPLFQRGGTFGTLRAVIDAPIPSLCGFGADPEFDQVVQRALTRDREERYGDATEFRQRLTEYAATQKWEDLHDSLSAVVSELAGEVVSGRRDKTNAARRRDLTASEGMSLVHATSPEELIAITETLDFPPELLEQVRAGDRVARAGLGEPDGGRRSDDGRPWEPRGPVRRESNDEAAERKKSDVTTELDFAAGSSTRKGSAFGQIAVTIVGFSVVAAAAVHLWLKPTWVPAAMFTGGVLLPLLAWSGLLATGPLVARVRAMLPTLVTGAVLLAVSAGWMAAPVRGAAAKFVAGAGLIAPTSRALFDPEASVSNAVCRGLERSEAQLRQDVVVRKLSSTTPESAACLVGQLDPHAESTRVVLDYLIPRWSAEVREAPNADEQALCERTQWMARAIKKTGRDADLSLLDCALRAETVPARNCCAQAYRSLALGQRGVATSLPPPETAIEHGGAAVAEFLGEIWNGEATLDAELRQSLELDSPVVRAWALSVHCADLGRDFAGRHDAEGADDALTHLEGLVRSECELPRQIEHEQSVWVAACQSLDERRPFWEATGEEASLLCRTVAEGVGAVAIRAARLSLERAHDSAIVVDAPGRKRARWTEQWRECTREGDGETCRKLAAAYRRAEDFERALELLEIGCEAGDPLSCNSAGFVLAIELPEGTPDKKRAVDFFERACAMGESVGCANLADELKRGRLTTRDLKRARQIYAAQCRQGVGYACGGLAVMYWNGEGVPRDPEAAIEYWEKACARGHRRACVDLALDVRTLDDRPPGIPSETLLLRKGCMVVSKGLCVRDVGRRYLTGQGAPRDAKRAKRHFEWACELGDEKACVR